MIIKKILFFAIILSLYSCKTTELHKISSDENQDVEELTHINVPKSEEKSYSLYYNTQTINTLTINNIDIEVLYGSGGRYIVKINNISIQDISLKKSELSIFINDEYDPEIITFAYLGNGVFSGFGKERKNNILYDLSFYLPETKHNSLVNIDQINIKATIKGIN